jgi:signal transduction histidine kinase
MTSIERAVALCTDTLNYVQGGGKARKNMFRPFEGSTRTAGTGLGLVIARDAAHAHGGDLILMRSDANGTVFRLTLPKREIP